MTTRYFEEPVVVHYRSDSHWQRVLALGVRRTADNTYDVLIAQPDSEGTGSTTWVPRSLIRVPDTATTCGARSS